jgi:carboxylate-amine ligase
VTATLVDPAAGTRRTPPAGDGAPTVGVEEEFALLDPATGEVALRAPEVIRACHDPTRVAAEAMTYMVEARTPVCRTVDELRTALLGARRLVADAAHRYGAACVATGVVPFGVPPRLPLTPDPRYLELARRFPFAITTAGSCGCHVHVGVADRQVGVEVLLRIRPWLPALVALTANSPIWEGADTGWASCRFTHTSRWPTAVPPPPVHSAEEYDRLVEHVVTSGHAFDARSVYFLARLSPRYPTVEVRVADVALTADEALAYAALVRALVATAASGAGGPAPDIPQRPLVRACRAAAARGLDRCTWGLVDALVAEVRPALRAHGDETTVLATLDRLRDLGGGADRQRRLLASAHSPADLVAALAAATGQET